MSYLRNKIRDVFKLYGSPDTFLTRVSTLEGGFLLHKIEGLHTLWEGKAGNAGYNYRAVKRHPLMTTSCETFSDGGYPTTWGSTTSFSFFPSKMAYLRCDSFTCLPELTLYCLTVRVYINSWAFSTKNETHILLNWGLHFTTVFLNIHVF